MSMVEVALVMSCSQASNMVSLWSGMLTPTGMLSTIATLPAAHAASAAAVAASTT